MALKYIVEKEFNIRQVLREKKNFQRMNHGMKLEMKNS